LIIARIYYLAPAQNPNPTLSNIIPSIITEGALEYAFISASVTSLKPFLRPFHSGRYMVNTIGAAGSGLRTNLSAKDSQDPYYQLSAVSVTGTGTGSGGKRSAKISQTASVNDDRPPQTSNTKISAGRVKRSSSQKRLAATAPVAGHGRTHSDMRRDDEESVNTDGSDQMIIRETRGWSVRYEDVDADADGQEGQNGTAWHSSGVACAV